MDSPIVVVSSSQGKTEPSIEILFADGPWVVPGWMIHLLGGAEMITAEFKLALQGVKYSEFTSGLITEITSNNVNSFFKSYINGSLR